ncbi:hypothetical protein Lal_00002939 [Lupinus albus]|nr:hypothetical protein Lal_00002939 [Lupinus albus]
MPSLAKLMPSTGSGSSGGTSSTENSKRPVVRALMMAVLRPLKSSKISSTDLPGASMIQRERGFKRCRLSI